ncbi:hypothetical protein [Natronosalvus vescus]|uniref:hypothetical protein n=1 Tax=Natronosalvus vescus TaxID=2953881 RepID=UPI0020906184|nr:hypothetical protein [Natronosalvus vescus]
MTETLEVQGTVVGIGLLAAVLVVAFGTIVSETIFGVDTLTVAMWIFAATFAVISLLHAWVGQYNFAWGHGGAAFGWGLVLLGSSTFQIGLGVALLVLSGIYIALLSRRATAQAT